MIDEIDHLRFTIDYCGGVTGRPGDQATRQPGDRFRGRRWLIW